MPLLWILCGRKTKKKILYKFLFWGIGVYNAGLVNAAGQALYQLTLFPSSPHSQPRASLSVRPAGTCGSTAIVAFWVIEVYVICVQLILFFFSKNA